MSDEKKKNFDGVGSVAEMLSHLDPVSRQRILKGMAEKDPRLTERVKDRIVLFEDLVTLEDLDFQRLLKEIPRPNLVVALRMASESFRQKLSANVSERAGKVLFEEVEGIGPQRRTDVEAAQRDIVELAKRLDSEGQITLRRS